MRTEKILNERFNKDNIIALATVQDGMPYVRNVNGFYEDSSFYVITYALSNKMQQIEKSPYVAISGDWFTTHGKGVDLGWFCADKNRNIAKQLREAFKEWIDNGHNNFDAKQQGSRGSNDYDEFSCQVFFKQKPPNKMQIVAQKQ